jgi:predicted dehydrogenase
VEKKSVRAGIIGAGFAARFHWESLRRVHSVNVEPVGVFCPPSEMCQSYADERGIRAFKDVESLIEAADVVHVCVPPVAHEEIAVKALERDVFAIVEKPLTGYFGDGSEDFDGDTFPKERALEAALASVERLVEAERKSKARICYAENWVYAPAVRKEREILRKTGGQVLWIYGEEAHSGSHSDTYGYWKYSGGGSLIGKGCHPLTAALHLKRAEGLSRDGRPIRPKTVSCRTHALTRLPTFRDLGHLRSDYTDVEDFAAAHITFEDGTIADIVASEIILGGIHNWLAVAADNHRTICNINPNNAMETYNPVEEQFRDIYVVEKTGTKQGWSNPAADEDHNTGYPQEIEAFYRTAAYGDELESDLALAGDAIATIYSAYVSAERKGEEVEVQTFEF